MSDNNRIQMPGRQPESEQPVKIDMTALGGVVQITFDPPIVRARFKPREARELAIAMLQHAELAENPPPKIET